MPPEAASAPDARWVNVIKPTGEVVAIPSYSVEFVLARGWQVETTDARRQRLVQERFGDRGAEAALAGVLRGATLGLSDPLLTKTGLVEPTTLAGLQEASPVTSLASEIAGVLASAALTKKAPAAQVSRLGAAVRGMTSARLGAGAGAKLAGMAAGFGAEGAVYGAGRLVSEEALGRADITAENVMAYVGISAAVGAGLGGVTGAAGEIVRRSAHGVARHGAKAVDKLYLATTGEPGKLGDAYRKLSRVLAKAHTAVGEGDEKAITDLLTSAQKRGLLNVGDDVMAQSVDDLGAAVDDLARGGELLDPLAMGTMKRDQVAKIVRTGNEGQVVAEASKVFERISGRLQGIVKDSAQPKATRKAAQEALDIVRGSQEKVTGWRYVKATKKVPHDWEMVRGWQADNTGAFFYLDRLKRTLGNRKFSAAGVQHPGGLKGDLATSVRDIYDRELRNLLTRPELWGDDVVRLQTEMNAAYQRYLHNVGEFKKRFMSPTKIDEKMVGEGKWSLTFDHDKGKLEEFLRRLGTSSGRAREARLLFDQHTKARGDLSRMITKHFDVPEPIAKWAATTDDSLKSIAATVKQAEERLVAQNQLRQMAGTDAISMAAVGYAVGGAPGVAAAAAITRPDRVIRTLAAIDRIADKVRGRATEAIDTFIEKAAKRAGRAAISVGPVGGVVAGRAGAAKGERAPDYNEKMLEVLNDVMDPGSLAKRISRDVDGIARDAPATAQHIVIGEMRKRRYLAEMLPRGRREPYPFDPPGAITEPTAFEKSQWLQRVVTAENPLSVLRSMERGQITRPQVETLKAVYPNLYEQIRNAILLKLPGSGLSYHDRLAVAALFDARIDRTLAPAMIEMLRPQPQQAPQQQPRRKKKGSRTGGNKRITLAERSASGTTGLLAREEEA